MQSLSCIQKVTCKILKSGSIPSHIGFIMDGNRRFAKKNKFSSTHQGHVEGVRSLKKCLLFCQELGIEQISLFCFSIENFNRSEEEVNGLMELCLSTFEDMSSMSQLLLKNQIKVKIIGRKQKLRSDVLQAFNKIESRTQSFTKTTVNFCFAYDSISEIESSIQNCKESSYESFIQNLQIPSHLDILVRTANEHRLSNFMLPQSAYAYICILKENWPEIGLMSFWKMMLGYNYAVKGLKRNKSLIEQKISKSRQCQKQKGE